MAWIRRGRETAPARGGRQFDGASERSRPRAGTTLERSGLTRQTDGQAVRHKDISAAPQLAVGSAVLLFPGLAVAAIEPLLAEISPALPLAGLILASAAACLAMRGLLAAHLAWIARGGGQAPDRATDRLLRPALQAVGEPNAEQGSVPGRANGMPQGAEQHLQQAIESAPSAIVMVDSHGRIVFANALAERMFGYRREQILGSRWKSWCRTATAASTPAFADRSTRTPLPGGWVPDASCLRGAATAASSRWRSD
jgi:PAS domain-containing protein